MPASVQLLTKTKEISKALAAVLAKWTNDSKYYKVDVLNCDKVKRQCKVRFEDKSEHVINCEDMHLQLNLEWLKDEYIVCAICDHGASDQSNLIIMCDVCSQGFHVKCHKPNISDKFVTDEVLVWQCSTCNEMISEANKKAKALPMFKPKTPARFTKRNKPDSDPETQPELDLENTSPKRASSRRAEQDGEKPRKRTRQEKSKPASVEEQALEGDNAEEAKKDVDNDYVPTQENLVVSNEVEVVTSEEDEATEKPKKAAIETKAQRKKKVSRDDKPETELDNALDTSKFLNQIGTNKDIKAA